MVFWLPTLIQSWGVKGHADDRHLCRNPERGRRDRNDPGRRSSDKLHERRWHFAACVAIAAIGLGLPR